MIQPEFKPLINILSGKLFSIPTYQRHYSWQKKQRLDLFRDILKLHSIRQTFEDRVHFMATIVCLKTQDKEVVGSNSFYVYEVVDGQQRLTTLIILLKAISSRLEREDQIDEAKELKKLLVKDDGRLIILQNNHDNRMILRDYIKEAKSPDRLDLKTIADHNLSDAIFECENFVNSDSLDSIILLSILKNCLFFIFQSLEDKGAVYTIFEVLNSRGLAVDWLDKCKSMLMGLLYENSTSLDPDVFNEHIKSLHSYWSNIYTEIGVQNISGQEIIRFAATLWDDSSKSKPTKAEDAIEYFRKTCTRDGLSKHQIIKKIEETTIWLKKLTSCLSNLYKDNRRNAVSEITQARLLAISIMLRDDLPEKSKNNLLEQWERTTFRIYGLLNKDARTKVGEYVKVAKSIFKERNTPIIKHIKMIATIGNEFTIEECVNELITKDRYTGWTKELRYFFYRYEEFLAEKQKRQIDNISWNRIWEINPNKTIEHILPQKMEQPCWTKEFSNDVHLELVHRIGNLCLLSQDFNSKGSAGCFESKRRIYNKTNLLSTKEFLKDEKASDISKWTKESIENRSKKLGEFASIQWRDLY